MNVTYKYSNDSDLTCFSSDSVISFTVLQENQYFNTFRDISPRNLKYFRIEKIILNKKKSEKKKRKFYRKKAFLKNISEEEFNRRKWRKDSFLKRIRRKFFSYLKHKIHAFTGKKIRLDHKISSSVSIDLNKKVLQMTFTEFTKNFASFKYSNINLLSIENQEFKNFLGCSLAEIFKKYYLESNEYKKMMNDAKNKEGSDFCVLMNKFAQDLVDFYLKQ